MDMIDPMITTALMRQTKASIRLSLRVVLTPAHLQSSEEPNNSVPQHIIGRTVPSQAASARFSGVGAMKIS
jgi:hypothetical protein